MTTTKASKPKSKSGTATWKPKRYWSRKKKVPEAEIVMTAAPQAAPPALEAKAHPTAVLFEAAESLFKMGMKEFGVRGEGWRFHFEAIHVESPHAPVSEMGRREAESAAIDPLLDPDAFERDRVGDHEIA